MLNAKCQKCGIWNVERLRSFICGRIICLLITNVLCESNTHSALDVCAQCSRIFKCVRLLSANWFWSSLCSSHSSIQYQFGVVFTNTKQYLILSVCSSNVHTSIERSPKLVMRAPIHAFCLSHYCGILMFGFGFQFFFIFFPLFSLLFSLHSHRPFVKRQMATKHLSEKEYFTHKIFCVMFAFCICIFSVRIP